MHSAHYQNVIGGQVLGRLPFDRAEVATGGIVSRRLLRNDEGSRITIIAGYSHTPRRGERQTVVFDVDEQVLIRIVGEQMDSAGTVHKIASGAAAVSISLRERLTRLKAGFGFSTKELAEVLRCSRAALYNWLAENHQGQVRDDTLVRLAVLERLVDRWNGFSVGNLAAHLHTAVVEHTDGQKGDLYTLLTQDELDEPRINEALSAIANLSRQQITESRRADDLIARGFGV
jgi:transcriptional regulator with XRE-family HTH domain